MKIRIMIIFLFLINMIYAAKEEFRVIATGNFKGEYKNLPEITSFVLKRTEEKKNTILFNRGNNFTVNPMVNDIFLKFSDVNNFDFDFWGEYEYISKKQNKKFYLFNSPLIPDEQRYKIIKKGNLTILAAGISDVYRYDSKNSFDYEKEIQKLIYKLENEIDVFILISELKRSENIKLINKFPEIAIVIETGDEKVDKQCFETSDSYIIPGSTADIVEFKTDEEIKDDSRYKKVKIINQVYFDDLNYIDKNKEMLSFIKTKEEKMKRLGEEIIGYNKAYISYEDFSTGENIEFISDISKKIRRYYNGDIVILTADVIKSKMQKGFYTQKEIEAFFNKDKIAVFYVDKKEIDTIYKNKEIKKGKKEYPNFFDMIFLENKEICKVIANESFFDYYKIDIKNKETVNARVRDFAGGD